MTVPAKQIYNHSPSKVSFLPYKALHEPLDAPSLLLHPLLQGWEPHMVVCHIKEQGLAGDGPVVRGYGGQGHLLTCRHHHKLIQLLCEGLHTHRREKSQGGVVRWTLRPPSSTTSVMPFFHPNVQFLQKW